VCVCVCVVHVWVGCELTKGKRVQQTLFLSKAKVSSHSHLT